MFRVRMVGFVKQYRVRVMVNGNVHRTACRQFNTRGCPAAPGKVVHNDFVKDIYLAHFRLLFFLTISAV